MNPFLTSEEYELVRKFLEIFSKPGFQAYHRLPSIKDIGCAPYVDSLSEFYSTLAAGKIGIKAPIDDSAVAYYKNPALIPNAPPVELRKMLYAMTRGERFCDGVFGKAIENGVIVAALKRILEADGEPAP